MTGRIRFAAVVGPTASGKTSLALSLAERLGGEIVCCDSMQIYRGMDIGTAKPTPEERARAPHHMVDFADPDRAYNCGDYAAEASAVLREIASRGKLPILCGGTGLYLDALLRGGVAQEPLPDEAFRAEMAALAEREGNEVLHARLRAADPEAAEAIHPNNVKRVIRALEICRSGRSKTESDRAHSAYSEEWEPCVIGLRYADRQNLYRRIDTRVDAMMAQGLLEETKKLREAGVFETCPTAVQAIGYKELLPYLEGVTTLPEAVEKLKTATRRYAKRQMTWFAAKPYVRWLDADGKSAEELTAEALNLLG